MESGYESTSVFIKQFEKGRGSKNTVDLDIPLALPQRCSWVACVSQRCPLGEELKPGGPPDLLAWGSCSPCPSRGY